jgi:hypothetical protein
MLKHVGAMQNMVCINYRLVHLLVLHKFLMYHSEWYKQCKSVCVKSTVKFLKKENTNY